ncbi:interleukin-17 receptor C [Centropristis striata]|uniref:interleukin-17 receptor C n=1 Tax=Centropristis striata TaxID=184440 RepID=UPI0027E16DE7|nr:interleukin-17 receptor C [Centropristis striata]
MFETRCSGTALAFLAVVVFPVLLECFTICKSLVCPDYVQGPCPVSLVPGVPEKDLREPYSECVTVRVWIKSDDLCKAPKIEILSKYQEIIRPIKKKTPKKCDNERNEGEKRVTCPRGPRTSLWELVYDCVKVVAGRVVTVSYSTTSSTCSVNYTVPDPIPDFDLSVNLSSESVSVTVEPGDKVYARLCYQKYAGNCNDHTISPRITIDPSQSRSALLNITYLLPCLCMQVYYTRPDSMRRTHCPFQNKSLANVADVWRSSEVTLYDSGLKWSSLCPAIYLRVSASLCWKHNEHVCTPVLNSTLQEKEEMLNLVFNTSAVDKHPQMCVQFSLQGSHNISCPFKADKSSWEVHHGPGRQSVFLYLRSSVPAKFSAQLCVLSRRECLPIGQVHSVTMKGNTESRITVPLHFVAEKPCLQVWQSDPALHGRRILCPDYTHNRCGMYAVGALVFAVVVVFLGIFIHRLTKSGAAGWLCIQEPVLLVCSSEQTAHVSAVCALASILQGELSAKVHMALWAQSSQTQAGTGVADLGPLPWLYGQWDTVRRAQGKVLIIWSPEATKTYEKWREERKNVVKNEKQMKDYSKEEVRHEKKAVEVEEDLKPNGRRMGKCKKEKAGRKKENMKLFDDKEWNNQREPSTVIAPVFRAALACLEGALQECKGQGVSLVYFQGLCHSRDIPKALRGVPRFCLPQDVRGLIQELGGMRRRTKTGKFRWHCWPRLLSKVLSIWLARQLAQRLQTLLPQMHGKKMQGQSFTSSLKTLPGKRQSRLKLPLEANTARPGPAPEHEPLHASPW